MSSARDKILGRIKTGVNAEERSAADIEKLREKLSGRKRGITLSRVEVGAEALKDLFFEKAMRQGCGAVRVKSEEEAVSATTDFLRENNLPSRIVMSPSKKVSDLPWAGSAGLEVREGAAVESDVTSITPVSSAVAETGTMVAVSGEETPTTLNFVPENHVLIVRESDLVGSYEDAFDRIREDGDIPRAINWLSGPSRSGDIGQTMYMGAHGPRRQHIILIEGA